MQRRLIPLGFGEIDSSAVRTPLTEVRKSWGLRDNRLTDSAKNLASRSTLSELLQ